MSDNLEEQKKYRISFSEYSTYLQCPHKWYLNYHLKLPGDINEELIFGKAIHTTIETLLQNETLKRLYRFNKEQVIKDIFVSCLKKELESVKDETFLMLFKNRNLAMILPPQAVKLISELDYFVRFKKYEVEEIEYKLDGFEIVNTPEVLITYKGFIDLVLKEKDSDERLIIDWKTSRKGWDINKKIKDNPNFFAQLCLYKYYYSKGKELDINNISTKFYNLPREEAKEQKFFAGNLSKEYIDDFMFRFKETALKIYQHKVSLKDFNKQKFITKQNFCNRCKFNVPEYCNDTEEFQLILSS